MAKTLQLRFGFARHCGIFLLHHKYVIYLFNIVTFFDNVRITFYFDTFELHMKLRLNYVASLLAIVTYFLLRHSYVIYLFVVVTFFDDVRIMLYFSMFELRTKITLQNGHFLVALVCNQK